MEMEEKYVPAFQTSTSLKKSTKKCATKTFSHISKDKLLTWGQDQQPD